MRFRHVIPACSGVIFVSPELILPAALKNASDVAYRTYGRNVWNKKLAAVITVSSGAMGEIDKAFVVDGKLNERTRYALPGFICAYADFIARLI